MAQSVELELSDQDVRVVISENTSQQVLRAFQDCKKKGELPGSFDRLINPTHSGAIMRSDHLNSDVARFVGGVVESFLEGVALYLDEYHDPHKPETCRQRITASTGELESGALTILRRDLCISDDTAVAAIVHDLSLIARSEAVQRRWGRLSWDQGVVVVADPEKIEASIGF